MAFTWSSSTYVVPHTHTCADKSVVYAVEWLMCISSLYAIPTYERRFQSALRLAQTNTLSSAHINENKTSFWNSFTGQIQLRVSRRTYCMTMQRWKSKRRTNKNSSLPLSMWSSSFIRISLAFTFVSSAIHFTIALSFFSRNVVVWTIYSYEGMVHAQSMPFHKHIASCSLSHVYPVVNGFDFVNVQVQNIYKTRRSPYSFGFTQSCSVEAPKPANFGSNSPMCVSALNEPAARSKRKTISQKINDFWN